MTLLGEPELTRLATRAPQTGSAVSPENRVKHPNAGDHLFLANEPSGSNSFNQAVESNELNLPAIVLSIGQ